MKFSHFYPKSIVPFIVIFGFLGVILATISFAAVSRGRVDIDSTEITGNGKKITSIGASDGSYVEFSEEDTSTGGGPGSDSSGESSAGNNSDDSTTGSSDDSTTGSSNSSTSGASSSDSGGSSSSSTTSGSSNSWGSTTSTSGDNSGSSDETTGGTSGGGGGERTLVWSEEFDSGFNSTFWTKESSTYGDGNNELQCYTPDQVQVTGGKLVLTAKEQTITCPGGSVRTVVSGMVRSKNVSFVPGQSIEWSVKLTPADQSNQGGLWPAFWSSGWAGGGWPMGGEWDGFEVMTAVDPKRTVYSLHFTNSSGSHGKTSTPIYSAVNFSQNWHTFRFNYGADGKMEWFRDGYLAKTTTTADTIQGWPTPFDQNMKSFKINLALGGNPGPLDLRALPATMEVGYVRIYQD